MFRLLALVPLFVLKILGIWWLLGFYYAWWTTRSGQKLVNGITRLHNLPLQNLFISTEDGLKISAWYVRNTSKKVVIILSGRGENRQRSLGRAKLYLQRGYSVLLPDLRATGKSEGNFMSFGWHERKDLIACYEFLKIKGYQHIAAHGYSLGAATIAYSLKKIPDFEFIIMESCYSTFCKVVHNITTGYHLPSFASLPMRFSTERLIGVKSKILVPEQFIKYSKVPTLIMSGDAELLVKEDDTLAIFNNCAAPYRKVHFFKGGRHENLLARFYHEYTYLLDSFLQSVQAHQNTALKSKERLNDLLNQMGHKQLGI